MAWRSVNPDGNRSVKANEVIGQDNTNYIQSTMGNTASNKPYSDAQADHFWAVDPNIDGRHRFVKMPAFSNGGSPQDAQLSPGIDGVIWFKTVSSDVSNIEGFYRNAAGIYQFIPSFLSGTKSISSSYSTVVAVPANVYGDIVMFRTTQGKDTAQNGFFRSNGSKVEAWANYLGPSGENEEINLKFGNGSDSLGLNILARNEFASSTHTWNYRITYRAI